MGLVVVLPAWQGRAQAVPRSDSLAACQLLGRGHQERSVSIRAVRHVVRSVADSGDST
ncbi:hypothetical protein [Paenibacillus tuaregi]|uniref:hypothetical protein n=1 Tax=Paenibacillus tuaregi TaxID=1816681 RepID=UPI0012FE60C1|nr:hypothetical protein [Paenibacillus tuaregi]